MAHFAELNQDNIVVAVYSVVNDVLLDNGVESEQKGVEFLRNLHNNPTGIYLQTSYNGNIRKYFAGIGFKYDIIRNIFIPIKPYPSWIWDEDLLAWKPPILKPSAKDGYDYIWDELILNWYEYKKL